MARNDEDTDRPIPNAREQIPPGAINHPWREPERLGGPRHSDLGDRHAAGTPAGGAESGGLAGSNAGDGEPLEEDLEREMGGSEPEPLDPDETAYGGAAGGSVGGTPARDRSTGGRVHGGLRPGGVHRGDSTVGSDPERKSD